jgi:ribose transport system ATP-binding protein
MREIICELKGICKNYSGTKALSNVDLSLFRGEACALLGKNGAGKSTLIKILAGATHPTAGELYFKGKKIEDFNPKSSFKRGISVLYQELHLLPNLTVKENMFVGQLLTKKGLVDYKKMKEITYNTLESLHIGINPDKYVEDLDTVQKQLVSIARALSMEGELFIFDEPSAILSIEELQMLYKSINKLKNMGKCVIYVTHMLEEAYAIADRVIVLRDGKKVLDDSLSKVKMKDTEKAIIGKKEEITTKKVTKGALNEKVKVELNNLCFKNKLQDINLKLSENMVYCIFGLEGSGKREIGKMLFGSLKPTGGKIIIDGKSVTFNSPRDGIKNGIGYMVDERASEGLLLGKSISDNIILPSLDKVKGRLFLNYNKIDNLVSKRINELGVVPPKPSMKVGELSGGNQQKVLLAKWLEIGSLLVLVDPTRGLDIETKERLIRLIRGFKKGRTILVIPSEIEDGLKASDWVIIMRDGKIVKNEKITPNTSKEELLTSAGLKF